jgi:hypothetical protein
MIADMIARALVDELGVSTVDIIPPWFSMLIYQPGG